jgi:uncharacterized protein
MRATPHGALHTAEIDRVEELIAEYINGRDELFSQRVAAGKAVDGHGDLLADHIYCLEDGPRLLDCLEFSDSLRHVDPVSDLASLAMDLEARGRNDLADRLLGAYALGSGDSWPPSLTHMYIAYRAIVRAKMACIRAQSGELDATKLTRALMEVASGHLELAAIRLVLIGGLPGSGKSTLAEGLGRATGWTVLRSDTVRKQLAGRDGRTRSRVLFAADLYQAETTAAVYAELLGRSERMLRTGHSVVLDASWLRRCWREAAHELATRNSTRIVELCCEAPALVAESRLAHRPAGGHDPSDAMSPISRAMALDADPWPEATTIHTAGMPKQAVDAALAVATRPAQRPVRCSDLE